MLKKENRLRAPLQQSNQSLERNAASKLMEDFKVEELVRICGLSEKSRGKKLEEEPPRGRAKDLPEEEKALMVQRNPGNRLLKVHITSKASCVIAGPLSTFHNPMLQC